MIKITYRQNSDMYASEYLGGIYPVITFLKYKKYNIAIPNVRLFAGETVCIEEFSNRRAFWNRSNESSATFKYKPLYYEEIKGQGFEIYDVIKEDDKQ